MNLAALGATRATIRPHYSLHTPDTFIRAPLPGMEKATAIVHASPALGARFTQYTAELETGGRLGDTQLQRFLFVLEGAVTASLGPRRTRLAAGGFAFLPADMAHTVSASRKSRLSVIEKPYLDLPGTPAPAPLFGDSNTIDPQPLLGDPAIEVRPLIAAEASYDFAVNTMTYAPGASLPMVEAHVMEHGLLMLTGAGIYRLGDDWHPVTAGDFIWMGPYCPQWFGALGKTPALYLIYKDWNRHPQD